MGEQRLLRKVGLCRSGLPFRLHPAAIAPPSTDDNDQEDGIGPEAGGSCVGLRHQIELNGLEQMREDRGELESGEPKRPEPFRAKSDERKAPKGRRIDDEYAHLDTGIGAVGIVDGVAKDRRKDTDRRCGPLVAAASPERKSADETQDGVIDRRAQHDGLAGPVCSRAGSSMSSDDAQIGEGRLLLRALLAVAEGHGAKSGDLLLRVR